MSSTNPIAAVVMHRSFIVASAQLDGYLDEEFPAVIRVGASRMLVDGDIVRRVPDEAELPALPKALLRLLSVAVSG